MKKVAIIYTVRPVLGTFPELLEEVVGEKLKIFNLLDDFLASDPGDVRPAHHALVRNVYHLLQPEPLAPGEMASLAVLSQCKLSTSQGVFLFFLI